MILQVLHWDEGSTRAAHCSSGANPTLRPSIGDTHRWVGSSPWIGVRGGETHACNWVLSSYTVSILFPLHLQSFFGLGVHLFTQERWQCQLLVSPCSLFTGVGIGSSELQGVVTFDNELTNRDVPLAGVLDRPSKANAKPMIHAGITARRNLRAKIHFKISSSSEGILTLCLYQSPSIARNSLEMDRSEHWFVPLCRGSPAQRLTKPESSRAWHGRLKVVGVVRSIQICVTVGGCERFCLTTRCMMIK